MACSTGRGWCISSATAGCVSSPNATVIRVGCHENHWEPGCTAYSTPQANSAEPTRPHDDDDEDLDPLALFDIGEVSLSPTPLYSCPNDPDKAGTHSSPRRQRHTSLGAASPLSSYHWKPPQDSGLGRVLCFFCTELPADSSSRSLTLAAPQTATWCFFRIFRAGWGLD